MLMSAKVKVCVCAKFHACKICLTYFSRGRREGFSPIPEHPWNVPSIYLTVVKTFNRLNVLKETKSHIFSLCSCYRFNFYQLANQLLKGTTARVNDIELKTCRNNKYLYCFLLKYFVRKNLPLIVLTSCID